MNSVRQILNFESDSVPPPIPDRRDSNNSYNYQCNNSEIPEIPPLLPPKPPQRPPKLPPKPGEEPPPPLPPKPNGNPPQLPPKRQQDKNVSKKLLSAVQIHISGENTKKECEITFPQAPCNYKFVIYKPMELPFILNDNIPKISILNNGIFIDKPYTYIGEGDNNIAWRVDDYVYKIPIIQREVGSKILMDLFTKDINFKSINEYIKFKIAESFLFKKFNPLPQQFSDLNLNIKNIYIPEFDLVEALINDKSGEYQIFLLKIKFIKYDKDNQEKINPYAKIMERIFNSESIDKYIDDEIYSNAFNFFSDKDIEGKKLRTIINEVKIPFVKFLNFKKLFEMGANKLKYGKNGLDIHGGNLIIDSNNDLYIIDP
jgi:hypothetical protein